MLHVKGMKPDVTKITQCDFVDRCTETFLQQSEQHSVPPRLSGQFNTDRQYRKVHCEKEKEGRCGKS